MQGLAARLSADNDDDDVEAGGRENASRLLTNNLVDEEEPAGHDGVGLRERLPKLVESLSLCYMATLLLRVSVSLGDFYRFVGLLLVPASWLTQSY